MDAREQEQSMLAAGPCTMCEGKGHHDHHGAPAWVGDTCPVCRGTGGTCPSCGGNTADCQGPDAQHAWEVETKRCFRTRARTEAEEARRKRTSDMAGIMFWTRLNDTKRKSAQT